jgi:hypothetical protein
MRIGMSAQNLYQAHDRYRRPDPGVASGRIEAGNVDKTFGILFPDLPGCFSVGDARDDALATAERAASA